MNQVKLAGKKVCFPLEVVGTVSAAYGSGHAARESRARVAYQFQLREPRDDVLDIVPRSKAIVRSIDSGREALTEEVRNSTALLLPNEMMYDLRSLMFCVGQLAALTIAGVDWPTEKVEVKFATAGASGISEDSLVYRPGSEGSHEALYVLALAARMTGRSSMYLLVEQFGAAREPKGEESQVQYLHAALRTLLSDSMDAGAYGDHVFAFVRGLHTTMTLRAHSDEGGWMRGAFATASYPRPSGVITPQAMKYGVMPHFGSHTWSVESFKRSCVTLMLETAAAASDADPLHDPEVQVETVLNNIYYGADGTLEDPDAVGPANLHMRPSAYPEVAEILNRIESYVCGYFNNVHAQSLVPGCNTGLSRCSFRRYLADDLVDKHFGQDRFMPYLYIEPGCVLRDPNYVKHDGPKAGVTRELDMFPSRPKVLPGVADTITRAGRHTAQNLYYDYTGHSLRQCGFYYAKSGAYNDGRDRGLSQMRFIVNNADVHDNMALLRHHEHNVIDEVKWSRPHCPIPAVGEGMNWQGNCVIEYSGGLLREIGTGLSDDELRVYLNVSQLVIHCVEDLKTERCLMSRRTNNKYRQYLNNIAFSEEEALRAELFGLSEIKPILPRDIPVPSTGSGEVNEKNDERHVEDAPLANSLRTKVGTDGDAGQPDTQAGKPAQAEVLPPASTGDSSSSMAPRSGVGVGDE